MKSDEFIWVHSVSQQTGRDEWSSVEEAHHSCNSSFIDSFCDVTQCIYAPTYSSAVLAEPRTVFGWRYAQLLGAVEPLEPVH